MKITIGHRVPNATSYRAARVKSLFNATDDQATRFDLSVDLLVGPSGSGKSSIGRALWDGAAFYDAGDWPDSPIVDAIAPDGGFDDVTGALASAGLGDVPTWLRPYRVLSTGQQFRADLARVLAQAPPRVVFDEFTSVVDRQIAQVGAGAFAKAWRRTGGQAVLLSCHYDILDWLEPDWVYDTATHKFTRGCHHRRPRIDLEIRLGGWELWPLFKPHHYLNSGPMTAARCYVAFVDGEPVAHLGMSTKNRPIKQDDGRLRQTAEARACRMVVMPEWQGAGIGMRFLNHVCELQRTGAGVLADRRVSTLFHTSHPQLAAALRRDDRWRQVSANLYGSRAASSAASLSKARAGGGILGHYGGHTRAVQGYRYVGPATDSG